METKTPTKQPLTIKSIMNHQNVIEEFEKLIGKKKAAGFITSVLQIANSSDVLKKCVPSSIYHCAKTAASLDLLINNTLGQCYIVPFGNVATLIIGYKGLMMLADRTGQYLKINALPVYDGQLIKENPVDGHVFDWTKKSSKIIGYYAFYILKSGRKQELYMTKEEIHAHAKRYSKTYGSKNSAWTTNEREMSEKTVMRLLLSDGAPMATEYAYALESEVFVPDNTPDESAFVDAVYAETNDEREKLVKAIDAENTTEGLAVLKMQIGADDYLDLQDAIDKKIEKLNIAKKK